MADFSRLPGPNADLWDWQLRGLCRGKDSSLFFHPEGERGAARTSRESAAKEICMNCPVQIPCASHALKVREPYGVWGGMTEEEREEHHARQKALVRAQAAREQAARAQQQRMKEKLLRDKARQDRERAQEKERALAAAAAASASGKSADGAARTVRTAAAATALAAAAAPAAAPAVAANPAAARGGRGKQKQQPVPSTPATPAKSVAPKKSARAKAKPLAKV